MDATQALIRRLAAEPAGTSRARSLVLPAALAAAALLAFAPVLALLGVRADLLSALGGLGGQKILAGAVTALGAAICWHEAARPDARTWYTLLLLVGLPAFATPALVSDTHLPAWSSLLSDPAGPVCFTTILVIGLLPLAVLVAALRQAAPGRPVLAGLAAGTLAAGLAACAYALHCTADTVGIASFWYPAGVAAIALSGGLVGARWLAW
jgi:hypothetical protein